MLGSSYLYRFGQLNGAPVETYLFLSKVSLIAFIFIVYLFYRIQISMQDVFNILDLLWKVFVTGLIATMASLFSSLLLSVLKENEHGRNPYFLDALYEINLGLIITFLIAAFTVWKRLILYQKSKWLIRLWSTFEYGLLGSSILFFSTLKLFDGIGIIVLILLIMCALVLSVNMKWVAYLNFKQKWKSILLIILISLYLGYFYSILDNYGADSGYNPVFDAMGLITVHSLFLFILTYSIFSILVLLFNLPTSSVFEQKFIEVVNFQKLSQSRNMGQNEEQVYEVLLESSANVALAKIAWLDIMDEEQKVKKTLYFKTYKLEKEEILKAIDHDRVKNIQSLIPTKNEKQKRFIAELKHEIYKSIFVLPMIIRDQPVATLTLVKDVKDGFSKEMIEIIRTFVNQASISIENYRLMQEAIINERYKEELKIAKRVQDSLLPKILYTNDDLEIAAFSKAAAEVGGDYFDTYKMNEHRLALIIGDVSGKGTSAAFHMSQMKGIFQSLVQVNLGARDFIIKANNALSNCLDRTSFITTTFFILDAKKKNFQFSRAGHCPTLYYSASEDKVEFLEDNGLGLGILRDSQFEKYVEVNEYDYKTGDILLLYTDGVTEAKNSQNEEFGYERLRHFLKVNKDKSAEAIKEEIIKTIYDFCGSSNLDDDITTMIVKVK